MNETILHTLYTPTRSKATCVRINLDMVKLSGKDSLVRLRSVTSLKWQYSSHFTKSNLNDHGTHTTGVRPFENKFQE